MRPHQRGNHQRRRLFFGLNQNRGYQVAPVVNTNYLVRCIHFSTRLQGVDGGGNGTGKLSSKVEETVKVLEKQLVKQKEKPKVSATTTTDDIRKVIMKLQGVDGGSKGTDKLSSKVEETVKVFEKQLVKQKEKPSVAVRRPLYKRIKDEISYKRRMPLLEDERAQTALNHPPTSHCHCCTVLPTHLDDYRSFVTVLTLMIMIMLIIVMTPEEPPLLTRPSIFVEALGQISFRRLEIHKAFMGIIRLLCLEFYDHPVFPPNCIARKVIQFYD
ncbi:unnamed protein product [Orchesella dallaii]|uniref:Uncharacterized protein n=1 Tax=Orchesella dallaii TaxID=48710 RepID=A0ABP1PYU5_9HEXA